ncbi:MAG: PBP1A family penicillin-binding protein [Desulfobacterota bacterium]|nr:PBP1A family penicillin-binding protein [Thermodesulfobacteriota bacterium]
MKRKKNKVIKSTMRPGQRMAFLLRLMLTAVCIMCIVISCFCLSLFLKIEDRFSRRIWDVPSKIYTDSTILRPGQTMGPSQLEEKLVRLGYRAVTSPPKHPGEYRKGKDRIEVVLRAASPPNNTDSGSAVIVAFYKNTLQALINPVTFQHLASLEIEPEEITQYTGVTGERRQPVTLHNVSKYFLDAVIAAEDRHFYKHPGIDLMSMLRALIVNLLHGSIEQGGSTITQQLVKNCFLTHEKSLLRKMTEAVMAVMIEQRYTKNDILELYINEIYLGQRGSQSICGIWEASHYYFGKHPLHLTLPESALIAGLIKAPHTYNPLQSPERCRMRRDAVLKAMYTCGFISEQELRETIASDIVLSRPAAIRNKAPYFCDYLYQQIKNQYTGDMLASMGMSLYTTLDIDLQCAAEQTLLEGLEQLERKYPKLRRAGTKDRLQGAIVAVDPNTGGIRALVGGRSYAESQFNRITQARRQPGSMFKPFVVASALDRFTPASRLPNRPIASVINGRQWTPRNYEPVDEHELSLRMALARSVNLCIIHLAQQIGISEIIKTSRLFGFTTPLPPYPSIAIGSAEVIPLELVRAYCVFASGGILQELHALKKVVDQDGKVLMKQMHRGRHIFSPEKAYMMNSLLRSVVTDGTARAVIEQGIVLPVAGKTGTTNEGRDAWYVGYTPELVCLVWVGFDDGTPTGCTGAEAAVPIWIQFMKKIRHYLSGNWYQVPEGIEEMNICSTSGTRAGPDCNAIVREVFLRGTAPNDQCRLHYPGSTVNTILRGIQKIFGKE